MRIYGVFITTACFFMQLVALPIQTDYAIFLFDNGEKNIVASMLNYAEQHDKAILDAMDFRIVFMGAAIDATSSIVIQANALGKKVLYVNPIISQVSSVLCAQQLLQKINNAAAFKAVVNTIEPSSVTASDIFVQLGMPKNGAQLLWKDLKL